MSSATAITQSSKRSCVPKQMEEHMFYKLKDHPDTLIDCTIYVSVPDKMTVEEQLETLADYGFELRPNGFCPMPRIRFPIACTDKGKSKPLKDEEKKVDSSTSQSSSGPPPPPPLDDKLNDVAYYGKANFDTLVGLCQESWVNKVRYAFFAHIMD